jgi:hypothetical protein
MILVFTQTQSIPVFPTFRLLFKTHVFIIFKGRVHSLVTINLISVTTRRRIGIRASPETAVMMAVVSLLTVVRSSAPASTRPPS